MECRRSHILFGKSLHEPCQRSITPRVVPVGLGKRYLVRRIARQAEAKVVRLHLLVPCSWGARWLGRDLRKQSPFGISRANSYEELMKGRPVPHSRERFAILRAGLA